MDRAIEVLRPFATAYKRIEFYGRSPGLAAPLFAEQHNTYYELFAKSDELGDTENVLLMVAHLKEAADLFDELVGEGK